MDLGQKTILTLFDVSSSFDSVDHSSVIPSLLVWLSNFLTVISSSSSGFCQVLAPLGDHKESILGPLLCILLEQLTVKIAFAHTSPMPEFSTTDARLSINKL